MPPDQRGKLTFDSRFRPEICDPRRIDHFNLAQLITGSEGTLAIMTAATIPLVGKPKLTGLSVVHFDNLIDACAATPDVLETEPSACELLDKQLMDLARAQPEWAKRLHFVEGDPDSGVDRRVLWRQRAGGWQPNWSALPNQLRARG